MYLHTSVKVPWGCDFVQNWRISKKCISMKNHVLHPVQKMHVVSCVLVIVRLELLLMAKNLATFKWNVYFRAITYGCEFVSLHTNTQIRKRQFFFRAKIFNLLCNRLLCIFWVGCQIMHPHHLCIFICRYQKLFYYCTLTSALSLIFLTNWPPIFLFFIKWRIWWYVTVYLHTLIQLYYSFTSSCSILHWYVTVPLCKFRIFSHLSFSCEVCFLCRFLYSLIF